MNVPLSALMDLYTEITAKNIPHETMWVSMAGVESKKRGMNEQSYEVILVTYIWRVSSSQLFTVTPFSRLSVVRFV